MNFCSLLPSSRATANRRFSPAQSGFTLVEILVSLTMLAVFALTSTACLSSFNTRAAVNRNAEAARVIVEDQIAQILAIPYDATNSPAALTPTAAGTDTDGDGVSDGILVTSNVPVVVTRDQQQSTVVAGSLYRRVTSIGANAPYSLARADDLLQVSYTLRYTFRGKAYGYRASTLKARN